MIKVQSIPALNQIFYPAKKFDSNLDDLIPYMYDAMLQIIDPITEKLPKSSTEKSVEKDPPKNPNEKSPTEKFVEKDPPKKPIQKSPTEKFVEKRVKMADSLFWAIYSSVLNPMDRIQIRHPENHIIQEKQRLVDAFKTKDAIKTLKNINFKITSNQTQEILSEIMTTKTSSLLSVVAYAIFYRLRIYIVNPKKQSYFLYEPAAYDRTIYVQRPTREYELVSDTDLTGYLRMESIDHPLKSVSNYKISDLEEIGRMAGIERNGEKKPDFYARLVQHYLW